MKILIAPAARAATIEARPRCPGPRIATESPGLTAVAHRIAIARGSHTVNSAAGMSSGSGSSSVSGSSSM
jgi:hypothetical protein